MNRIYKIKVWNVGRISVIKYLKTEIYKNNPFFLLELNWQHLSLACSQLQFSTACTRGVLPLPSPSLSYPAWNEQFKINEANLKLTRRPPLHLAFPCFLSSCAPILDPISLLFHLQSQWCVRLLEELRSVQVTILTPSLISSGFTVSSASTPLLWTLLNP